MILFLWMFPGSLPSSFLYTHDGTCQANQGILKLDTCIHGITGSAGDLTQRAWCSAQAGDDTVLMDVSRLPALLVPLHTYTHKGTCQANQGILKLDTCIHGITGSAGDLTQRAWCSAQAGDDTVLMDVSSSPPPPLHTHIHTQRNLPGESRHPTPRWPAGNPEMVPSKIFYRHLMKILVPLWEKGSQAKLTEALWCHSRLLWSSLKPQVHLSKDNNWYC